MPNDDPGVRTAPTHMPRRFAGWLPRVQWGLLAVTVILVATVIVAAGPWGGAPLSAVEHTQPRFQESVGFASLVASVGYLVALGLWGWMRRQWQFVVRHVVSAALMLLLVVAYLGARGGLGYNGHSWNQSFADASVILYAVTLGVGPLARLWRPASKALPWRRETSIWATIAAAVHVAIFWEWSLDWDWRLFFYPGERGSISETLRGDASAGATAFQVANVVGLVAILYALLLALTSNDFSQRWLKSGWTWLQKRATTMWLLVLLHTWIFAYFVTFTWQLGVTLWISFWAVLLVQTGGFAKTVWSRRRASAAVEGTATA